MDKRLSTLGMEGHLPRLKFPYFFLAVDIDDSSPNITGIYLIDSGLNKYTQKIVLRIFFS